MKTGLRLQIPIGGMETIFLWAVVMLNLWYYFSFRKALGVAL